MKLRVTPVSMSDLRGTGWSKWSGGAWRVVLLLTLVVACVSGCGSSKGGGQGELTGRKPVAQSGVRFSERLNDGRVPAEGSGWNTNATAVFASRDAYVDFDLGKPTKIDSLALMGDNNDTYSVLGSDNGRDFLPIWVAPRSGDPGMRWRHVSGLAAQARYLRVQPQTGDASLSLAELSVFSEQPGRLPPSLKRESVGDGSVEFRSVAIVTATLLVLLSLVAHTGASVLLQGLVGLFLAGIIGYSLWMFEQVYPLGNLEVSLVRGLCGAVGAFVVLRGAFAPERHKPLQWVQVTILGWLAALSVCAFFNMGKPQFFDAKHNEPSVVHNYDMRVYFPVAKYFDELKYDGLYLASVMSFAEEHGGVDNPMVLRAELRDLRDHRMRRVSDIRGEVVAVKDRFSEARWAEFKKDMAYFWETMGTRQYLGSMADHGGNATPVWLAIAHLMYANASASNATLLWGAALDPLLLLVFGFFVWRSFGAQSALVCLIIYGANDFYMFGSNWAGATLRNDWMVYLGLGACALKTERYKLGGALLAMSALIRAFPAIALLALGVPVVAAIFEKHRKDQKLPEWRELMQTHKWFVDTVIGASVCVGLWCIASSALLGWDAWPLWVKKISSFTASPHVNHLGWLTVVAGSEGNQASVLRDRMVLYVAGIVVYFGLAIWIGLKGKPHRVALLGILMMPVFMYPANYYIHFIFLLPLMVDDLAIELPRFVREASGKVWALLLGLCAAQYFTVRETDLARHFYNASILLMLTLLLVLLAMLPRDEEGRVDFSSLSLFKN